MLWKLQRKTLIPIQIIGYALTLFVGVLIVLITVQLYYDVQPLLSQQTDVLQKDVAVISKNISIFKTIKKNKLYFTKDELDELQEQDFVANVAKFNSATFKISAFTEASGEVPKFYTELFFESIPDQYLDAVSEDWIWDKEKGHIPIIIPESYLNLYNFGFAESQGLPVLSKNTIGQVQFNVRVTGNGDTQVFTGSIVGFSNKINSILVPEHFLSWANTKFGKASQNKTSRILVQFSNPSDKGILAYFNENDYTINQDKLEFSKMLFFFKGVLLFVLIVALIIVILSIAFLLLSINLILQKNKNIFINLYNIGYNTKEISIFYQVVISITTVVSILLAIVSSLYFREFYLQKFEELFDYSKQTSASWATGVGLLLVLLLTYNLILVRKVRKTVND